MTIRPFSRRRSSGFDIIASGEVVTSDVSGVLPREDGELPLEIFLRQTDQTKLDGPLKEFAHSFSGRLSGNRIDALHELMGEISDRVEYHTAKTDAHATAAEAFALGRGVCQDHAHIFIGCARALGVPARYISGYLYDGEQSASYVAGHAWAAAWIDGLGWVSFDVSNCKSATDRYVSIAVGLDYESAAPIRGIRSGGVGAEELDVAVNVSGRRGVMGRLSSRRFDAFCPSISLRRRVATHNSLCYQTLPFGASRGVPQVVVVFLI